MQTEWTQQFHRAPEFTPGMEVGFTWKLDAAQAVDINVFGFDALLSVNRKAPAPYEFWGNAIAQLPRREDTRHEFKLQAQQLPEENRITAQEMAEISRSLGYLAEQ